MTSTTGITEKVSVNSFGEDANDSVPGVAIAPQDLSSDGRFVAFESNATNLVDGDTNSSTDIFVHDRQAPQLARTAAVDASESGSFPVLGGAPASGDTTVLLLTLIGVATTVCGVVLAAAGLVERR
jgi:hypothetical protein